MTMQIFFTPVQPPPASARPSSCEIRLRELVVGGQVALCPSADDVAIARGRNAVAGLLEGKIGAVDGLTAWDRPRRDRAFLEDQLHLAIGRQIVLVDRRRAHGPDR